MNEREEEVFSSVADVWCPLFCSCAKNCMFALGECVAISA